MSTDLFEQVIAPANVQEFQWVDGLKFFPDQTPSPRGQCGPNGVCEYEYLSGKPGLAMLVQELTQAAKHGAIFAFDFETSPRKTAPVDSETGKFFLGKLSWSTRAKENGSEPHTSVIFLLSLSFRQNHSYVCDVREMRKHPTFLHALSLAITQGKPVAHNMAFDWRFLKVLTGESGKCYFDTMIGTQMLYAGLPNPWVPWDDPDKERPRISRRSGKYPAGTGLGMVLKENLGVEMDKGLQAEFLDVHPDSPMTDAMIGYAAGDTALLLKLTQVLRARLEEKDLWSVWERFEAPFLPILSSLMLRGLALDIPLVLALRDEARDELTTLEGLWNERYSGVAIGNNHAILAWVKQKFPQYEIKAVDREAIEEIAKAEGVPEEADGDKTDLQILLEYRKVSKVESTYLTPWIEKNRNPITGNLHPDASQAATDTGRLAFNSPNAQNIPGRGRWAKVRDCFIGGPGRVLVDVDFSQFEVRALADMSGEEGMIDFFRRLGAAETNLDAYLSTQPELTRILKHNQTHGKAEQIQFLDETYSALEAQVKANDFHTLNAQALFGEKYAAGDTKTRAELRVQAKSLSFGIPYGIGAGKIAREFKIDENKAQGLIDAYYQSWPKVKAFLEDCKRQARFRRELTTPSGRKRFFYVPESFHGKHSNIYRKPYEAHWSACERESSNFPLQSINGDVLKQSCIRLAPRLKEYDAHIVLLVHDEILADSPEECADEVMGVMQEEMEQAALDCGILTCPISTSGIWYHRWVH